MPKNSYICLYYPISFAHPSKLFSMSITTVSQNCIKLIETYECSGDVTRFLTAYKCPAGVMTIGVGTTMYPTGEKVKEGDVITIEQAYEFLRHDLDSTMKRIDAFTRDDVSQSQFDALVSFGYNIGTNALKTSTLLKVLNANPNDPQIAAEFQRWSKAGGKVVAGLLKRRRSESHLYFTGELKFDFPEATTTPAAVATTTPVATPATTSTTTT